MGQRPTDETQIVRFDWQQMDGLHRAVAKQIQDSGFRPDVILGILRCGQVPAVHLSYILGIRTVEGIRVRSTPTDDPLAERIEPEVVLHTPSSLLRGKKILLVDAVMESGTTVARCLAELGKHHPDEVKTAMIVDWNNSSFKVASGIRPTIDYFGTTADRWPDFPWEH
jgi:hypothetical protein